LWVNKENERRGISRLDAIDIADSYFANKLEEEMYAVYSGPY